MLMATNSGTGIPGSFSDGVYSSSDSGSHWTLINNGLSTGDINSVAISPANPSVIYAGLAGGASTNNSNLGQIFYGGVNTSADGGANWTALFKTPPIHP